MRNILQPLILAAVAAALVVINAANARAGTVFETINGGFSPGFYYWIPNDTGWFWTPSTDVELEGIQTKLRTAVNINNNVTFTTTVYTDRPGAGGTVLDSFTWNGTTFVDGTWLGGSFASPLSLTGGVTYFLGFSGWGAALDSLGPDSGAGVMMVEDFPYMTGTATPGTTLLEGWFSSVTAGSFDTPYAAGSWPNTPILRFIAADQSNSSVVPEPTSMVLFGLTALGLGVVQRRRRGQQPMEESGNA